MKLKFIFDMEKDEEIMASLHRRNDFANELEELVTKYNGEDSLAVYTDDDIKILKFSDIECVTVINGKSQAVDRQGEFYRVKRRLYEIEEILPASFVRINKSSIANKKHIEKFSAAFSGGVDVVFKSGYKDYVSRRCFAEIKKELKSK